MDVPIYVTPIISNNTIHSFSLHREQGKSAPSSIDMWSLTYLSFILRTFLFFTPLTIGNSISLFHLSLATYTFYTNLHQFPWIHWHAYRYVCCMTFPCRLTTSKCEVVWLGCIGGLWYCKMHGTSCDYTVECRPSTSTVSTWHCNTKRRHHHIFSILMKYLSIIQAPYS